MLTAAGILGLLQSTVLPALILIRVKKLRGGIIEQLLRMFPLSLITNYLLIYLLSLLHLYTRPLMFGITAAEIICIILLYRNVIFQSLDQTILKTGEAVRRELKPLSDFLTETRSDSSAVLRCWIWAVSGCFALSGVLWAIHLCRLNFGTVFTGWDTLFSWNAYARTWAAGRIPGVAGMYPQLVASNWSVSYLLQGESAVQFFNTLLPPVFFLLIQGMLFDLGFQRRESGFFFAAVISRFLMKRLMGDQLFDGYMDVPAAAMSLMSVYTFLKAENRTLAEQRQAVFLGVVFAAAAAVTKQSGFVTLILAPLAVFMLLRDAVKSLGSRQKAALFITAGLIVIPWYLRCMLGNTGGEERELIAAGITDFNRLYDLSYRLRLAVSTLGKYGICFLFSLIGLPLLPKKYRLLFFLLSWPLTILWACKYSYDARNLGPALPYIALICGLGASRFGVIIEKLCTRTGALKIPFAALLFLLIAASVFALIRLYPDSRLTGDQYEKQKSLFGERMNRELLYGIFGETHEGKDIYTDYPAYFLSGYQDCCSAADLNDAGQVRSVLTGTDINWLLLPLDIMNENDPAGSQIGSCIDDGHCSLIGCSDGYYKTYCLYELKR